MSEGRSKGSRLLNNVRGRRGRRQRFLPVLDLREVPRHGREAGETCAVLLAALGLEELGYGGKLVLEAGLLGFQGKRRFGADGSPR